MRIVHRALEKDLFNKQINTDEDNLGGEYQDDLGLYNSPISTKMSPDNSPFLKLKVEKTRSTKKRSRKNSDQEQSKLSQQGLTKSRKNSK